MKKIIWIFVAVLTLGLASCGSVYTVSGGNPDEAAVAFVADDDYDINVYIDNVKYERETIEQKGYRSNRNTKRIAKEKIVVSPGRHSVKVTKDDKVVYEKEIFISASEVRVIEL